VKAALESVSNRASDFVSQSQLQLQKIMQTYNVTVSLLNSMQTMLAEMNKSIAQNIR
jgi:secreted effector protein SseB